MKINSLEGNQIKNETYQQAKDKSIKYLRKELKKESKDANKMLELLQSNEEKIAIELESKKKDQVIKRYRKGRKKLKEQNKFVKEALQELENELQNIAMK